MKTLLIKNIQLANGRKTTIYIEGNKIVSMDSQMTEADAIIDGSGKAALPSFVNGHSHAAMTLFRGHGDDMELMDWLENEVWPVEAHLTHQDIYWGTKLACLEMIKNGITFFNDMYWGWKSVAKAVTESGLRANIPGVALDQNNPEKMHQDRERILRDFEYYQTLNNDRIRFSLAPHAIYTVSEEQLRWLHSFSAEHNLLIHIHVSETEKEVKDCLKKTGKRPIAYLDSIGFLDENVQIAHCVWVDDAELDILAERKVSVIINPVSNMKLTVNKLFPYPEFVKRGIPVTIGTDGAATNNNLDILEDIKFATLLTKFTYNDPKLMPVEDAFSLITTSGSNIFHLNNGLLEEGKDADLILVDLENPSLQPNHSLISNMIYSANGSVVDTTICQGNILMQNREIPNEKEIIEQANEAAKQLFIRSRQ